MTPLAAADDVAHALGLDDADALTDAQSLRVDALLAEVSRQFRREAEREFTPGTTIVGLITVAGRVRLPDPAPTVANVTSATYLNEWGDTISPTFSLDGQELLLTYNNDRLPSGVKVTVTYQHTSAVPAEVVSAVARIVGRNLNIDPLSAQAQSKQLSTTDYSQTFADWVSNTKLLTEDDCETARSYRYPTPNVIIQQP